MVREGWIRGGHTGTFALLAILAAVEGAISTWISAKFHKNHNAPNRSIRDRTNLLAFNSWFTFLFAVIYLGLFLHSAHGSIMVSVGSHAIFLVIIWILWTAAVASITASLGGGINCSKIDYELVYCNQLNAEMGFGWAIWVVTTIALVSILLLGIRSARHGEGWRGHMTLTINTTTDSEDAFTMGVTAMDVDQGTPETSQIPLVEGQTPVLPPVDPNALPSDASETVYIQNLNEKVKLENMKTSLRHLFKHYGNVLNVTAHKNLRMRGQAFVSFESKEIAAKAVKEVKGFPLYGKPMQLSFAKTRSDAVVEKFDEEHMDQHLVERKQRKKRTRRNNPIALRMKAKKQATQGQILNLFGVVRFPDITFNAATDGAAPSAAPKRPVVQMPDEYLPPNRVLFLQNLPAETITKEALQDLFGQYPNLIEIRTVPTKKDIAFVEYADEDSATKAKDALHNYKIDGEAKIKITYARK